MYWRAAVVINTMRIKSKTMMDRMSAESPEKVLENLEKGVNGGLHAGHPMCECGKRGCFDPVDAKEDSLPDFQFRKEEGEIVLRVPHIGEFGITHAAHTVSKETATRLLNELSELLKENQI
jgi:hypothetical protein